MSNICNLCENDKSANDLFNVDSHNGPFSWNLEFREKCYGKITEFYKQVPYSSYKSGQYVAAYS